MTSSSPWQRMIEARRHAVSSFFDDVDDAPANDLDRTLDSAVLEAAQRMDPAAGHSPWLDVRVSGPHVGVGALNVRIVDELLPPIQAEIDAALPDAQKDLTSMELVGVGAGSAILRLQPTVSVVEPEGAIPASSSVVDSAIRRVLDLHDAVERQDSPEVIASASQPELISRLQRLVSVLEANDLSLELLWRPPTAARRTSSITGRGRTYASRLFEREPEQDTVTVSGYIYEQSLRGVLKLKQDPNKRNSHTYEIHVSSEVLSDARLTLGAFVRVRVERRRETNRLGQRTEPTYEFVEIVGHGEVLGAVEE